MQLTGPTIVVNEKKIETHKNTNITQNTNKSKAKVSNEKCTVQSLNIVTTNATYIRMKARS